MNKSSHIHWFILLWCCTWTQLILGSYPKIWKKSESNISKLDQMHRASKDYTAALRVNFVVFTFSKELEQSQNLSVPIGHSKNYYYEM